MIELILQDLKTNKVFSKWFTSPYFADRFKNKVKYSKKLKLIGEFKHD